MNLYIMRHGIASEVGEHGVEHDAERPLTPEGRRKTKLAGQALRKLEINFEVILSSPLVRTLQTAEILADEISFPKRVQPCPALAPPGDMPELLRTINRMRPIPENLLLVGHEPFLSNFIGLLIGGKPGALVTMKKGALCRLSAADLRGAQCATLEWLLTARVMSAMG